MTSMPICHLFLAARPGLAALYTDPGSGALLWQLAFSALVGFMFYFRRFANWISSKVKGKRGQDVVGDKA